jgi:hypothetical protein
MKPFPADHEGRGNDLCSSCHVATEEEQAAEPTATPAAEPEAESAAEAEPVSEEIQEAEGEAEEIREEEREFDAGDGDEEAEGPPLISHTLEGRDDCLLCHGLDGVKPFPADHERRTPVMCPACHQRGGEEDG